MIQSPGDLMKDDIADDLEWSLKVISTSSTMNVFIVVTDSASAAFCRHTWRFINVLIIIIMSKVAYSI